jgi:hypothetical protein
VTYDAGSVSGGSRSISVKIGDTTVVSDTFSDYGDGKASTSLAIGSTTGSSGVTKYVYISGNDSQKKNITLYIGDITSNRTRTIKAMAGSDEMATYICSDYGAGIAELSAAIKYGILSPYNRSDNADYFPCDLYNNSWQKVDEVKNGVYVPMGNPSYTENGTYYAVNSAWVGFRSVTINVPDYASGVAALSAALKYGILSYKYLSENADYFPCDLHNNSWQKVDVVKYGVYVPLKSLDITDNGTFTAYDYEVVGFRSVNVNVEKESHYDRGQWTVALSEDSTNYYAKLSRTFAKTSYSGYPNWLQGQNGKQVRIFSS